MDRLPDAGILGLHQIADIDGEQHVGRAVPSFRGHALDQTLLGEDHVDLDAGLLGEVFEQRVDEIGLAVGIDIHLAGIGGRGGEVEGSSERKQRKHKASRQTHWHFVLLQ